MGQTPHRVNVTYAITEHQVVKIGEVVYLGQKQTRLPLIEKTTKLATEEPMRREQLLAAESRLYDLGVFDWSSVGPLKPITTQTEETAVVKIHEAKRNEITYGVGFEVSHRGGNVTHRNGGAAGGRRHDRIERQPDRAQPVDFCQPAGFNRIHPAQHSRFGGNGQRVDSFVAA